ncbi:autoinducer binding domain-containing protein [Ostreiculturibacter nitratireducens]|uniref:autoinducer binding domain-containing protein n=1 Tax=Ostreiculturibacter nitratireducens TaxID=3075226 RepID=UPI0031B61B65
MDQSETVVGLLRELGAQSPAGFAIALHISYAAPKYLFQAYPQEWIEYYSANGLVLKDPTVRWGFANVGHVRWSELESVDPDGVMAMAREQGLKYGVTLALDESGSRSVASFARSDREFSETEIERLSGLLGALHTETALIEGLSPDAHETLRRMSILLTHS